MIKVKSSTNMESEKREAEQKSIIVLIQGRHKIFPLALEKAGP
jgi:hypothetical protein